MFRKKKSRGAPVITTLLGRETRIDGNLEFSGGCLLEGYVKGNVRAGEGSMISISEGGCVEGTVEVENVLLNGTVKGDVVCSGRVELSPSARVVGNVQYRLIELAIGAEVNGKLIHDSALRDRAAAGPAKPRMIEAEREEAPEIADSVRAVEAN